MQLYIQSPWHPQTVETYKYLSNNSARYKHPLLISLKMYFIFMLYVASHGSTLQ